MSDSVSSASSRISTDRRIVDRECWSILLFSAAASAAAIMWSWNHRAMLNYGDAVAHLHIARRVLDSRTPRFTQLGSVWLPLPHILLIPFVQNYEWWATGLAGVIPSALAYLASCAGIYRLARHWVSPGAAAVTLAFFALNPNLLYLQTTAMTEPLFLCEVIWIVVWLVEWQIALNEESEEANLKNTADTGFANSRARHRRSAAHPLRSRSNRLQIAIAAGLVAAVFTRYDGWVIALIAWAGIGVTQLGRARRGEYGRISSAAFWLPSIAVVAAPIAWFVYNAVGFGDWLYFARGPFSAKAIEVRTAANAPGCPPHPGWHSLWVSFLYYVKVSELDAAARAWGNAVLALAATGTAAFGLMLKTAPTRRAFWWVLLLWLPVPFYCWSVAYGSVPIFFPTWWPYTWYNTRYGLEMLPALALGVGLAAELAVKALNLLNQTQFAPRSAMFIRFQQFLPGTIFLLLCALTCVNAAALLRSGPTVYVESTKNLDARLPYDDAIPPLLRQLLSVFRHAPVLMNTSAYPEIVASTGIPLRQTINESDLGIFKSALAAPATHAGVIVAFDGDDVDRAVKQHPADLEIAGRFTAQGQPAATIYVSSWWANHMAMERKPNSHRDDSMTLESLPK